MDKAISALPRTIGLLFFSLSIRVNFKLSCVKWLFVLWVYDRGKIISLPSLCTLAYNIPYAVHFPFCICSALFCWFIKAVSIWCTHVPGSRHGDLRQTWLLLYHPLTGNAGFCWCPMHRSPRSIWGIVLRSEQHYHSSKCHIVLIVIYNL